MLVITGVREFGGRSRMLLNGGGRAMGARWRAFEHGLQDLDTFQRSSAFDSGME